MYAINESHLKSKEHIMYYASFFGLRWQETLIVFNFEGDIGHAFDD
jgi:hypothetical protein